jgi:hypothetical protein
MEKTRVYLTESLARKDDTPEDSSNNLIGIIISITGYLLIVLSFIAGGYFSIVKTYPGHLFIISSCLGVFLIGLLFLGIGQIIKLLKNINKKL